MGFAFGIADRVNAPERSVRTASQCLIAGLSGRVLQENLLFTYGRQSFS
jgi:hypothetical protein